MEKFIVRFELGQRDSIRERATHNRRSMNSEILALIERGMCANVAAATATSSPRTMPAMSVDELFAQAFGMTRDPRSAEYRAGVRAALVFRIDGVPLPRPYPAGTAQDDAFFAGQAEGHAIWRRATEAAGAT
jgi:hypothetical protein